MVIAFYIRSGNREKEKIENGCQVNLPQGRRFTKVYLSFRRRQFYYYCDELVQFVGIPPIKDGCTSMETKWE